jgi:uncharacterized protein (TIGR02265 family)
MHSGVDTEGGGPAFGTPEELEERLRLVRPDDTVRGFVLNTLLDTVREEAEPAALQRCLAATGEKSPLPFFSYPFRALLRLQYTAAWELSAKYGGVEEALRHLGRRTAPDFLQSAVGHMLLGVAGLDVKRLIGGIPVAYPTVYSHGSCTLSWPAPHTGRLFFNGNLIPPPFMEAAVFQVLRAIHPPGLEVQARRLGPTQNELLIRWD